jgi:hypothetical protein
VRLEGLFRLALAHDGALGSPLELGPEGEGCGIALLSFSRAPGLLGLLSSMCELGGDIGHRPRGRGGVHFERKRLWIGAEAEFGCNKPNAQGLAVQLARRVVLPGLFPGFREALPPVWPVLWLPAGDIARFIDDIRGVLLFTPAPDIGPRLGGVGQGEDA